MKKITSILIFICLLTLACSLFTKNEPLINLSSPIDNAEDVSLTPILIWNAENANSYDVYFGESNDPPLIAENMTTESYNLDNYTLEQSTEYFWKIVAKAQDETIESEIWSFTTYPTITVIDHSSTVVYTQGISMWDFDQAGPSGFVSYPDGSCEATSTIGNGDVIDFWYNDYDYTEGAYFVSADGDSEVYYWGDVVPKTTYFEEINDTATKTAPDDMSIFYCQVHPDSWYWVRFDNGDYGLIKVISYASPYDFVSFDFYYQTDGTQYFLYEYVK